LGLLLLLLLLLLRARALSLSQDLERQISDQKAKCENFEKGEAEKRQVPLIFTLSLCLYAAC